MKLKSLSKLSEEHPYLPWILFFLTLLIVFFIALFASTIMERRVESLQIVKKELPLYTFDPDSSHWKSYFPREYDTWKKTALMDFKSKYNGNIRQDALAEDPKLVVLWAGYPFSKDYYKPRGHHYTIEDVRETLRTGSPKNENDGPLPNTCWSCKSPDVLRVMDQIGPKEFYKGTWAMRGKEITHPIGCADCHDPRDMSLRMERPALKEAMDLKDVTHQEKRSLVCAQCHVEYYFAGKDKYLTFPWKNGLRALDMERYYDEIKFSDWTHALSQTPMLKAQHPDFELFKVGIHGQRGLSCADCHMPYVSEGAVKYSDHQIKSPLQNIERTCQVCHRESEETLLKSVYEHQDQISSLKEDVETVLVKLHYEAKKAWDLGANKKEMEPILTLIRHASWRWDFAVASHGASFHAPLEVMSILSTALSKAHDGRYLLRKLFDKYKFTGDVEIPDISTKEKAQKSIGLDIKKLEKEKKVFLDKFVPLWDKHGENRSTTKNI